MKLIEMFVYALAVDEKGTPILMLSDMEQKNILPMEINPYDAELITLLVQGTPPDSPMIHKVMAEFCGLIGAEIKKVVVTDIKEDVFTAHIHLKHNDKYLQIEARPSDTVILAFYCSVPIYMDMRLIEFTIDREDIKMLQL